MVDLYKKENEEDKEIKDSFIKIDGVNINKLGLNYMRSSLSIIP